MSVGIVVVTHYRLGEELVQVLDLIVPEHPPFAVVSIDPKQSVDDMRAAIASAIRRWWSRWSSGPQSSTRRSASRGSYSDTQTLSVPACVRTQPRARHAATVFSFLFIPHQDDGLAVRARHDLVWGAGVNDVQVPFEATTAGHRRGQGDPVVGTAIDENCEPLHASLPP